MTMMTKMTRDWGLPRRKPWGGPWVRAPPTPAQPIPSTHSPCGPVRALCETGVFPLLSSAGRRPQGGGREQRWWGQSPVRQENSRRKLSYPTLWTETVSFRPFRVPSTILQGGMMGQLSPVGSDSFIYHLSRTPSLQIYPPWKCLSTVDYFKNWIPCRHGNFGCTSCYRCLDGRKATFHQGSSSQQEKRWFTDQTWPEGGHPVSVAYSSWCVCLFYSPLRL